MHPKGNHPSNFQVIKVSRFRGQSEQTNTENNWHPITLALEDRLSEIKINTFYLDCDSRRQAFFALRLVSKYFTQTLKMKQAL